MWLALWAMVLMMRPPYALRISASVDGAVDIAREAADIILLEKSLMVLEKEIIEDVALSPTC
ncbi:hypothetical protein ACLB1M_02500 [Escherichia coli]